MQKQEDLVATAKFLQHSLIGSENIFFPAGLRIRIRVFLSYLDPFFEEKKSNLDSDLKRLSIRIQTTTELELFFIFIDQPFNSDLISQLY